MNAQDRNRPVEAPWQLGLLRTQSIGGERGEGGLLPCGMCGFQVGAAPQTFCALRPPGRRLCFLGDQVGLAGWTRGRDFVGCIEAWQGLT